MRKLMFRMDVDSFQYLLEKVLSPLIGKEDTLLRQSVLPVQRLQVTLRYLASDKNDIFKLLLLRMYPASPTPQTPPKTVAE